MCPAQFSFLSRQYPIIFCDPMKEAGFGGKRLIHLTNHSFAFVPPSKSHLPNP